jgi:hypothetical protein
MSLLSVDSEVSITLLSHEWLVSLIPPRLSSVNVNAIAKSVQCQQRRHDIPTELLKLN